MGGPERDQVAMWGEGYGASEGPGILVVDCIFRLIVLYHTLLVSWPVHVCTGFTQRSLIKGPYFTFCRYIIYAEQYIQRIKSTFAYTDLFSVVTSGI